MIYGIGTDILFVPRIEEAMRRFGARFSDRILVAAERDQLTNLTDVNQRLLYVAKRFAAKEAFAKALGSGIGSVFTWHDIAVANDKSGKPRCVASDTLSAYLSVCGIVAHHISLSDERDYVLAFVTLETA